MAVTTFSWTGGQFLLRWQTVIALTGALFLLTGCREQQPLQIGYVGGLTGRVAGLGVAGRDGALLAIEEANRAGGVAGRPLELVTRDDQQQPESAARATGELIDSGVVAIIGPMTSAMAMTMYPLTDRAETVLISPTATTNQLSKLDDHFFRLTLPLHTNAQQTAAYALRQGLKRCAVSLDTGNAAFTEDWLVSFQQAFEAGGGRVVQIERFKSGAGGGVLPHAERLLLTQPDAILLLSGAMDTALFAQQIRKKGSRATLFASEWAFTGDVINFGGSAVEGMLAFVTYDPASQAGKHIQFVTNFEARFGYKPSFAAVLAYESAGYLLAGLARNPQRSGLKEALLQIDAFTGLQGDIRFNRYGDPERMTYLATIRQGRFATSVSQ